MSKKGLQEEQKIIRELEKEIKVLSVELGKVIGFEKDIIRIEAALNSMIKKLEELKKEIMTEVNSKEYINKDKFEPIRILVYGLVGLILTAFVVALTGMVIPGK